MRRRMRLIVVPALLLVAAQAHAASMTPMQGAWVEEGFDCAATFETTNGKVAYKNRGDELDTGIIVTGNRIEGPNAICTADRVKEGSDGVVTVLMSCSSSIMAGNVATSFRMLDADHFEHFQNDFPDMIFQYQRCKF